MLNAPKVTTMDIPRRGAESCE
jgi:hypothetical protein